DDDDDGEQLLHVREVSGDLYLLADSELVADDAENLPGHQAAPRKRPALLEPADERRQCRGQDDVPVQAHAPRAHHTPDADQERLHVVDPAQKAAGDRWSSAEDHNEEDGLLVEPEEKDRDRKPNDRRHRLEPEDGRADGGAKHRYSRDQNSGHAADRDRDRITSERPSQRYEDSHIEVSVAQVLRQALEDRQRPGQDVVRLPAGPDGRLPRGQDEGDRGNLRPEP